MTRPSWYLTQSVTLIKRRKTGAIDAYGADVYAETPVVLSNCLYDPKPVNSIQYAAKVESTDRMDKVTDFGTLFFGDVNVDAEFSDRVILDGGPPFDITGPVERHFGTRLGIDYASANVKRVT